MNREIRNQTLVAASLAKQSGFENTYLALIETLKELDRTVLKVSPRTQNCEELI